MSGDDRVAYVGGFITTTLMTVSLNDIVMTSVLGLIGGFFGIMGKHIFYLIRDIWKTKRKY